MKRLRIALWIAIGAVLLALIGVWGFAWYYFIYLGNAGTSRGNGFAVYEEFSPEPERMLSVFLEENDFLINEPEEANLTILCGEEITGEITVVDEQGNVVCRIENDGSGVLSASVLIEESEVRIGGFTASADGEESNTVSFYVLPEVTEDMFARLDGVARDLEKYVLKKKFDDPYGKEAFEQITRYLEEDERVEAVAENNGVILFQTVDCLMGSYGLGRKEGLTFGHGFSDEDETYKKWRDNQSVREDVMESIIPITNNKIYHYAPYNTDEAVADALGELVKQEKRLESSVGMEQLSFIGDVARKMIKEGDFTDCGFWVFNTHGFQLQRSDGSDMLFFALGEVDENAMMDMLDEAERRIGYHYFWGELKGNAKTGKLVGPESYRMVYDVASNERDGTVDRVIWGSTCYLEDVLGSRMFDNTVVYFAICYGYSDPKLRTLLFRHGASAFIGCEQPLSGGMAVATLEHIANVMGQKDKKGNGGSLQDAMGTSMDKTVRGMLFRLFDDAGERRDSWEFLQEEMRNNPMLWSAPGMKHQRIFDGQTVIEGKVIDPEGEGISGATVTACRWLNHNFKKVKKAVTDSDGKYSLTVPRGIYGITAEKETGSHGVVLEGSTTVQAGKQQEEAQDIILGLAELVGTVKDEETGEPIEGAAVQWQTGGTASSVSTDENGMFTISDLVPGDYSLRVTKEGYQEKRGITAEVETGTTTVLLDDILMKKELNYYRFIRDELLPQMGYASTETTTRMLTPETAWSNQKWDVRKGILSADIADFDGDGTEDLVVYYFGDGISRYANEVPAPALYAALYTKNEQEIYPVNSVLLEEYMYATGFSLVQAGVMEIGNQPFIYVETNSNAYFADGGTFAYTWYGYDGAELRPYWMVGKTDGGTSDIADSLLTYSDARTYTKQLLWADSSYLYRNSETPLAGSDWARRMDGTKLGFALLDLPEAAMSGGYDGYGGNDYPTYWAEDYLTKSFQYKCIGTGTYSRKDMQVTVSDETRLKEHIEALGGR